MKLQFLTQEAVDRLESAVSANLSNYRDGQTASLVPTSAIRESKIEVEQAPTLLNDNGEVESDAVAARRVYQWLQKLDASQASDPRLWTFLTHVTFAEYLNKRWSSGLGRAENPDRVVIERWFFRGEGLATFFRNGLSRLWWFAHLTYDPQSAFELTDVLLSLQDLQQAFLERSLARCQPVLKTVLRTYKQAAEEESIGKNRGDVVKRWAIEMNKRGGVYILDALPADRLEFMVKQQLRVAAR